MPTLHAGIDPRTDRPRPVSITEHQMQILGFAPKEKPYKLGCGTQACAYLVKQSDSIVKITADPRDARISYHLMKQPSGCPIWAIPIRAVYRISSDKFIICSAKAEKLPEEWVVGIDTIYDYTEKVDLRSHQWPELRNYIMNEIVRDELLNGEEAKDRAALMKKSLNVINEMVEGFAKIGCDFCDFHSGNIGLYSGRPVLIDLGGISEFRPGQRAPVKAEEIVKTAIADVSEIPLLPFHS